MKIAKKILCMLLVLVLTALSISGCTKKEQNSGNQTGTGQNAGQVTEAPPQGNEGTSQPTQELTPEPTQAPATPTPTPTPVPPTPTPTEIPKPEGKTYEDNFKSVVAGGKENFDAEALKADGFTVVTSAQEFIEAIRPGAAIVFAPGKYNLSDYTQEYWDNNFDPTVPDHNWTLKLNEYVSILDDVDGVELRINGVDDMLISGGSENVDDTEIVIDASYAAVLSFDLCNNIDIANLKIGHVETGTCEGNVIDAYRCSDVHFYNMDIYGCGVYGIGALNGTKDVYVYDSIIHDCSYGAIEFMWGMGQFKCVNCRLVDTAGLVYHETAYSKLTFDRCTLGDWETTEISFRDDVELIDCKLGEIQYYPEYEEYREDAPQWLIGEFDPSTFDFESMEDASDGEYLTQSLYDDSYSFWHGYMMIDTRTGEKTLLPSYDIENNMPRDISCGFRFPDEDEGADAKARFWISMDADYYGSGTWFYSSLYSAVLQFEEKDFADESIGGENDEPWYGDHVNVTVFRDRDDENSHPWLMMELGNKTVWFY